MYKVIPAVIPKDVCDLNKSLEELRFAPLVQVDVVDGVFAKPASWPYVGEGDFSQLSLAPQDLVIDLMVAKPYEAALDWISYGAKSIVVHLESVADLEPIIVLCKNSSVGLYISGNDDLPFERYSPWLPYVDGVQLMGIHTIGSQGQPFSEKVIDNISILKSKGFAGPIMIDGSVNQNTITRLKDAGASEFVIGSAISSSQNKRDSYQSFINLLA